MVFISVATLGISVSPHPSNSLEIPFEYSKSFGLILIRAEINGKPAVLLLDTGSNNTSVNSKLVDVVTPPLKDTVTSEKGSGYSGTAVFTKASLKVGPVLWRDHRILAMDLEEISKSLGENIGGILGMDFLNEFKVVVVNLGQHKLILER